jgi:hypothetical protein
MENKKRNETRIDKIKNKWKKKKKENKKEK